MANEEPREVVDQSSLEAEQSEEHFVLPEEPARYLTRLLVSRHRRRFRESLQLSSDKGTGLDTNGPA